MRQRLIGLLAFAMMPLACVVGFFLWVDHNQTIANARNGVFSVAQVAAVTEARIFDQTQTLLKTLSLVPVIHAGGGDACSAFVARVKAEYPQYNTIGVVDASGTITCHNTLRARQGLSDPVLLSRMMAKGAPGFMIGNFVNGKVSGKPTVITALLLPSATGTFAGAIFASLNLDRMTQEVQTVSQNGKRSVLLFEPMSTRVITHYPPLTGVPFGTPFPDHPLMRAAHASPGGGDAELRGIDGVDRVYGFAPLPGAENIVLAVGEDRATLMAPVRQRLFMSSIALVALLLAGTSLVWWVSERSQLRPFRRLMDSATRIGAGNFNAGAELEEWQAPEFRQLGRLLDDVSAKLDEGRRAEAVVAASEARFRVLAENTADIITCSDASGRRIYVSPASRDLGYEPHELMGSRPRDLAHPDDMPIVDFMMAEMSAGRSVKGVEYRVAHRDGSYRWAEIAGKPLDGGAGAVFVMRDVTDRKLIESQLAEASVQLERLASTDALTGLANRRALDTQLQTEFARAMRDKTDLSFLLIDVDSFKGFNDTYGHPAGDECLRRISGALQASLRRPGDVTARYGGEELAAIMPGTSAVGALERAEFIRQRVRELGIPHSGSNHAVVTISVGVATLAVGSALSDVAELIQTADRALYEAKANGRDRVIQGCRTKDPQRAEGDSASSLLALVPPEPNTQL